MDIEKLASIAQVELARANDELVRDGNSEGSVRATRWDPWRTMVVVLFGEFGAAGGAELELQVEIDPAQVGWRITAMVRDYGVSPSQIVTDVHTEGIRTMDKDAANEVRRLSQNAVAALRQRLGLPFAPQQGPKLGRVSTRR